MSFFNSEKGIWFIMASIKPNAHGCQLTKRRSAWLQIPSLAVMIVLVPPTSRACRAEDPKVYATILEPEIRNIAFSPDGKTLAIRSGQADVVVWDVGSRKRRAKFEKIFTGHNQSIAFLSDGKSLAMNAGTIVFRLDLTTGKATELYRHKEGVLPAHLVASADGKLLASCDFTNIIVWDVVNSRKLASLSAEKDFDITSLALFPDGRMVAGSGLHGLVRGREGVWLWDIEGKRNARFLPGRMGLFAVAPDGKSWATVGSPGVLLWETQTDKLLAKWRLDIGQVTALAFSPNGKVLVAAGGLHRFDGFPAGHVAFVDTSTGKVISTFKALPDLVGWMSLSPDGKLLAVSTELPANEMKVYDVFTITAPPKEKDNEK